MTSDTTTRRFGLDAVSFSYGDTPVLQDVSIGVTAGRVVGLVGQNGAGKSTAIKILSGAIQPGSGTIRVNGEAVTFGSPAVAKDHGVITIHQDPQLFPDLTVAQCIQGFAGRLPRRRFAKLVHWATVEAEVSQELAHLGIDIDPSVPISGLSLAQQRMVELAGAMRAEPAFLILDEITSSLEAEASSAVLSVVRRLAESGTGVVVISHLLNEIEQVCDQVVVMRDGRVVEDLVRPFKERDIVVALLGPQVNETHRVDQHIGDGREPLLNVRDAVVREGTAPISLSIKRGEILGCAGVLGSGAREFVRLLGGADHGALTAQFADGSRISGRGRRHAARRGVSFLSGDRGREGTFPLMSIAANMAVSSFETGRPLVKSRKLMRLAEQDKTRLGIKMGEPRDPISSLSGGNQQKVLIARTLREHPRMLCLDEPTQGVDVGARGQIHDLLKDFADADGTVVVYSSDAEELAALCDRVAVFHDNRLTHLLEGQDLTVSKILIPDPGAAKKRA